MSQQWQKKKLYQSQKLHLLQRVNVVYELCFLHCGSSSPLKSFHRLSVFKALKHYNENWYQ